MWYTFQLLVVGGIIYIYETEIPHPNATLGHVVTLGILVAYCLTWLITKAFDLLSLCVRIAHRRFRVTDSSHLTGVRTTKQLDRHSRINSRG